MDMIGGNMDNKGQYGYDRGRYGYDRGDMDMIGGDITGN